MPEQQDFLRKFPLGRLQTVESPRLSYLTSHRLTEGRATDPLAMAEQAKWLEGTFRGEGCGTYPTIKPFEYVEEVRSTFSLV